jgi:hypothetical protein
LRLFKLLDIVLLDNPQPDLNVLRAVLFRNRYEMKYSDRLRTYLTEWIDTHHTDAIQILLTMQNNHYGKQYLNDKQLALEFDLIK